MAAASLNVDSGDVVVDAHQFAAALAEGAGVGAGHAAAAAAAATSVLPRALAVFSFLTSGMGAATAVYKKPSGVFAGHELAYYVGLGGVFAAGVADVWTALWVAGDVSGRRHAGKVILCAASIPLLLAVGLSGYAPQLK